MSWIGGRGRGDDAQARPAAVLVPRAGGAGWLAAAVAAYLFAEATGDRWFLLAAACAAAPVLVSVLWRPRRRGLEVHADPLPPRAVAGETVEQTVRVANTGSRALAAQTLAFASPGYDDLCVDVPPLRAGASVEAALPRRAARRGGGVVHGLQLSTTVPFGLIERRIEGSFTAPLACVHPAPAVPVALAARGGGHGDEPAGASSRRGPHPHAVREWRPGDEVRQVHWRSTARHGRLVVVEPERAVAEPLALVVAGRADARAWEDLLAVAAASAAAALQEGRAVLLLAEDPAAGGVRAPVLAPRDAGAALDWFALLGEPRLPGPDLLRRAAQWAGRGGIVTVAATDPFLAEAVRTGVTGTPYGRMDATAAARPELAVDGVPVPLGLLLPAAPTPPGVLPPGPLPSGAVAPARFRVVHPAADPTAGRGQQR